MRSSLCRVLLLAGMGTVSVAQGRTDYLNFESPQVKPITVARVDGGTFLLVCNTPDNSVEVYDISDATKREHPVFVTRIPVGLEPVSVVYHSFVFAPKPKNMMYTVNWLGDSVTYVQLFASGGAFSYKVVYEAQVTDPIAIHEQSQEESAQLRCDDEPMHLAVLDNFNAKAILVTKRTASSYTQLHAWSRAMGVPPVSASRTAPTSS